MRGLWTLPTSTLDRVVFLESLSKVQQRKIFSVYVSLTRFCLVQSHGLCRERLGMVFCSNQTLFTHLNAAAMGFSAGPGQMKDLQFSAVAASSAADKQGVEDLHVFWSLERRGLVRFLLQPKFAHLFDPREQQHITADDMDNPCTLYVLLRAKEGVRSSAVFEETGALGVDTPLKTGHYIRFAVGMMKGPFFSKQ